MIGDTGANISDLVFVDRKPDFFKIEISIDLRLRRSELAKTVH